MSKDAPSIPFAASKRMQSECNENEFENLPNSVNSAPIRSPLNTIPDPSQCQTEAIRASGSSLSKRIGNSGPNFETSKVSSQVTPARRTSSVGTRLPQYTGGKGGSSSRVSRAIAVASSEPQVEVPCFELVEDLSFWNDHNVQVLIRVRPISSMEQVSQGYGRCLRQESAQTLTWLGHPEIRFTFDHIACEMISQEKLFRVAGIPMVDNCMSGYNSCMFAYGQTGSGKTYTMMGDIGEMDGELNEDCGITPRIFEYLFTRIKEEVENRKDEGLLYSCKCSFLEIYNEQITDLLEPSSTNLHLREDVKKGVYVENLMEYTVCSVDDVLKLLLQGTTNRKIAATHMNSESSRSHSVFTCTIESRWENDSMTHLRFGRLNLVDLAGSERQKSSGAEGDRLREAANINKSLSTLGLVIMSLVDLAHGKHRHVPYRDSRLTFLLQDSLGGNSKTTIIANVSPSICSSNETLSTLKFAQRAKLIQNNAKINEDASGDVTALQRQIQQLKMNGVKATLLGALRREKLAETAARRLEAELEQMNHLAHQREEDAQCTKMMLRFREEKIKRLELLSDGLVSADKYLLDENNALVEEIQLLKARIDRNPELTRFALENIRLLEQLRLFQGFYEQGEREMLLAEVSELRDQVETTPLSSDSADKMASYNQPDNEVQQNKNEHWMGGAKSSDLLQELTEARLLIEAMEREQVCLIEELELVQKDNHRLMEILSNENKLERNSFPDNDNYCTETSKLRNQNLSSAAIGTMDLQIKFEKVTKDLEEARLLSSQYLEDRESQLSREHQNELIREEVEMETAKTILHLQEEVAALQLELQERLSSMVEENKKLRNTAAAKENEMKDLHAEWESASLELTSFLLDGSKSLKDATGQIESIAHSFPHVNVCIGEHIEKAAKVCVEKEERLFLLQKSLEDAQRTILQMEQKLNSLKGATMAFAEVPQSMLSDHPNAIPAENVEEHFSKAGIHQSLIEACANTSALEANDVQVELARTGLMETDHAFNLSCADAETFLSSLQTEIHKAGSFYKQFVQEFVKDIHEIRKTLVEIKENHRIVHIQTVDVPSQEVDKSEWLIKDVNDNDTPLLCLRKEFMKVYDAFNKLNVHLAALLNEKAARDSAHAEGVGFSKSLELVNAMEQLMFKSSPNQSSLPRMSEALQSSELMKWEAEADCSNTREFVADLRDRQTTSFFTKFEEANATMKEADLMLNALLKANENAKELTGMWKQAGKTLNGDIHTTSPNNRGKEKGEQNKDVRCLETVKLGPDHTNPIIDNWKLQKELDRKDVLLKGLLFDFSLLQESASTRKDIQDESEQLIVNLREVQNELEMKINQLNEVLVQHRKLEGRLADTETALLASTSDLGEAQGTIDILSDQISELRVLLKDLYLKKSEAEEQLEEQRVVVKSLEQEILRLTSTAEKQSLSSIEGIEDDLRTVTCERDSLIEQVGSLHDRLEMAYAVADENEAVAVEARQESEASKMYAEQKEEEVKILERSVEELECTINVMEKKMNLEKDQELSQARLRIEELDTLAASRQKENLIDQCQLQKLVEEAQQQTQESIVMEQEVLNLKRQLSDLLEERERCISEVNRREADILAAQLTVEQLQERDQLLTAKNEMLK
ncbi:hypothetical protein RJ639_016177, partial [Escallonia herrerae]